MTVRPRHRAEEGRDCIDVHFGSVDPPEHDVDGHAAHRSGGRARGLAEAANVHLHDRSGAP